MVQGESRCEKIKAGDDLSLVSQKTSPKWLKSIIYFCFHYKKNGCRRVFKKDSMTYVVADLIVRLLLCETERTDAATGRRRVQPTSGTNSNMMKVESHHNWCSSEQFMQNLWRLFIKWCECAIINHNYPLILTHLLLKRNDIKLNYQKNFWIKQSNDNNFPVYVVDNELNRT